MLILAACQCPQRFTPGQKSANESFRLAAGPRMRNKDLIGQGGHKMVPTFRLIGSDPEVPQPEWRKDQQAAFAKRVFPEARDSHAVDTASRTHDHRLSATKKQGQALLLHRRVEATDHRNACITQSTNQVVGSQDYVTRALDRTEQG